MWHKLAKKQLKMWTPVVLNMSVYTLGDFGRAIDQGQINVSLYQVMSGEPIFADELNIRREI